MSTKELNATIETAKKCSERPNPVILPSNEWEKLGFLQENTAHMFLCLQNDIICYKRHEFK